MVNYPGLSYPLFIGKSDIVHYDILSIYVKYGTLQPRIYLPLEIWIMITDIKFELEMTQWNHWIYSDENCCSERRYYFRKRNYPQLRDGVVNIMPCVSYNNPFMGNNYASDIANMMNNLLNNHSRYRCHGKINYSFSIINLFNILKKYHHWLINVPRKYKSVIHVYDNINSKIYNLYDEYIYYNDINSCCQHHEFIIKRYITDSIYYLDRYNNCRGESLSICECDMCWNFHDYVYNFDDWKLNVRVLRNGKIMYLKPGMYQNDYLTPSDIM